MLNGDCIEMDCTEGLPLPMKCVIIAITLCFVVCLSIFLQEINDVHEFRTRAGSWCVKAKNCINLHILKMHSFFYKKTVEC